MLIARYVPHDASGAGTVSVRSELAALRSGRLWLALAACATRTGGVLSTYSCISPLLTGRTGLAAGVVPLVLAGFGAARWPASSSAAGSATRGPTRRRSRPPR